MSAPDTNTETEKKAHKTPLVGMIAVVVFALVLLLGLAVWLSYAGNDPGSGSGVVDGISTEVAPTEQPELPAQTEEDAAEAESLETGEGQ